MSDDKDTERHLPPTDDVWRIEPVIDAPRGENVERFRKGLESILLDEFPFETPPVLWGEVPHPDGKVYEGEVPYNVEIGKIPVGLSDASASGVKAGDSLCFVLKVDEGSGTVDVAFWTHIRNKDMSEEKQRERWGTMDQREEDAEKFARELIRHLQAEWSTRSDDPAWTQLRGKEPEDAYEYVHENGPTMDDFDTLTWPLVADLLDGDYSANYLGTEFHRRKQSGEL